MEEGETDHEDTFREDEDTDESTEDGQQLIDKGECFVSGTENPCTSAEGDLKQDNCKLQLQGPHHCSVCGKAFSRPYHVVRHMATHSGNRPHDCPVCGKQFTRKASLVVHQRVHTGERPYSCSECGVSYAQLACLRRHRLRHASERPYHCSVCRRGFIQRRYLIQHERTHTGERPYHCPVCPKRFASTTGLKEHQKSHTEENLHACSLCDRVFTSTSSLKDHVRKHTGQPGPHPCPLCRRSFNRPGLLKKHMCIHTGDGDTLNPEDNTSKVTLHRCVLCDAYFTPEKLEQHNLLHQRGLPYVCEICGRSFSRKSRLEEHVMSHTGEKPYQCDVCKKRFAIKRVFKKHQQIHTRGGSTTEPLSLSVNSSLPLGGQDQEPDDHLRSHQPNNTMSNQSLSPDGNNGLRDPLVKNRVEDADAGAVIMSDGEEIQSFQPDSQDDADASAVIMSDGEEIQSFQPVIRPKTTRRKIHVCSVCNKSYTRPSRLKEHMKIHIEENEKLHCSICPKSFLRPSLLKKHLRLHMQDGLTAEPLNGTSKDADNHGDPSCNKGSDKTENEEVSVSGLINSDGEEENWKPIIIDQNGCPESQELKEVNSGKPKHCCPVCGRDCQKASALVKHLRIHSGERPYTCPTCGKSFTQQVHMTEHQRIHTGEKPYTCVGCQKSFSFSSALRRHQRLGRCRGGVDKC